MSDDEEGKSPAEGPGERPDQAKAEAELGGRVVGGLRRVGGPRVVVLVLAHRGPGASLNWTGTRPTP